MDKEATVRTRLQAVFRRMEKMASHFLASGNKVAAMPRRLRPTAPTATGAVLVGDPGRALLLAQELLEQPKMSNHARGLWGYYGTTPAGGPLTIQSTGIGGPSAALVLADLAKLGVQRAVRVGTCVGLDSNGKLGALVVVSEAVPKEEASPRSGRRPGKPWLPSQG